METDALGNTTRYFHDSTGNLLKTIRPNQYDEQSDNGEGTYYEYDYLDRPVLVKYPDGSRKKTVRDMDGNILSETPFPVLPEDVDSLVNSFRYDGRQYLVEEQAPDGAVTYYERDRNGNLLKAVRPEAFARNGKNGAGISYVYDAENRITAIKLYLYDERNRLIQKSSTNPDSPGRDITTYEYDLQGSLLKEEGTDFCKQYLYNDFHQCIQTEVIRGREEFAERLVQENLYDGEGLRFAIIENGKRTGFITDGWNNVAEIDENGRVTKRIIRGMGIVASEDTEQKEDNIFTTAYHYYHGNERMDVEYITDEAGNVVNSYTVVPHIK